MSLLRALRQPRFALLWTGQVLSRLGDFAYEIIIAWWVLEETGSALVMSSVLIVAFLPVAFFTAVGGVVADRQPRAWVMVLADALRAVIVLGMAYLAFTDRFELWAVYVVAAIVGSIDAFFQPAYFGLVPEIVPEEDLPSANALSSMSFQLGRVLGPLLGGFLATVGGVTLGLTLNGLSFLVGMLLLLPLLPSARAPEPPEEEAGEGYVAGLLAGLGVFWRDPVLRLGVSTNTLVGALLVGPFLVALPFLADERFEGDPRAYGLLLAVFPIGFLLGSIWAGRRDMFQRPGRIFLSGAFVGALALAAFGLPLPLVGLLVAAVVNGFALELSDLSWTYLLQRRVSPDKLGRIASLGELGFWLLTPLAIAGAGLLAENAGPRAAFLVGGTLAAWVAAFALVPRTLRALELPAGAAGDTIYDRPAADASDPALAPAAAVVEDAADLASPGFGSAPGEIADDGP